jgi:hypothetical protein
LTRPAAAHPADPPGESLAAPAHSSSTQEQPVEGDVLLEGQGDEEIRVGRGPVLIAVNVLLKDSEFASKLPLRSLASDLREALGKFLLVSLD